MNSQDPRYYASSSDEAKSATERIDDLMNKMDANRPILLAIINFCRETRSSSEIDSLLQPLQSHRRSVYTPIIMRDLLCKSGALEYLIPDSSETTACEDDNDYLIVPEQSEGVWLSTEAGLTYYHEHSPLDELSTTIASDADYESIYHRILLHCSEKGRTASELSKLVDDDPLVQNPRRLSGYFVDKLETSGALVWTGSWNTTPTGLSLIPNRT